jgi:prophage regulatory protein
MDSKLLRIKSITQQTGNSRSTIYLRQLQGLWPKPVRLGPRMVAWPASEVQAINDARIAGKTDVEIKELVKTLEKLRLSKAA